MPILLALLLLIPSALSAQEVDETKTISVIGTASVERQPDQAVIHLSVESFAVDAQSATADNSTRMERVIRALRQLGLKENQIRTQGFSVNPEYDYSSGTPRRQGEDRLIGYRVRNTVVATINDLELVGRVIDVAIGAGVNRVAGLNFQLRDPEAARNEAIRLAITKARAEAETVAQALGGTLGQALSVSTTGALPPPRPMARAYAADMAMAAPPIEPGVLEVSAQVAIIFIFNPGQ